MSASSSRVTETLLVDRMTVFLADEHSGDFEPIRSSGFAVTPPALKRRSGIGGRLEAGHTIALDDPLDQPPIHRRRDRILARLGAVSTSFRVSRRKASIAVLGLGRKDSAEPLNSEDMALLAAVAGQAATALENGRLYRQLRTKADELDRLREFNENVLESLDDGLVVLDLEDRVVRWNHALEQLYGMPRAIAIGRPLADVFEPRFVEAHQCGAAREPVRRNAVSSAADLAHDCGSATSRQRRHRAAPHACRS